MDNISSIFPLEGEITQEILNNAKTRNSSQCIGAITLKEALDKKGFTNELIEWLNVNGRIMYSKKNVKLLLTTKESVPMMFIKHPMKITFIIRK